MSYDLYKKKLAKRIEEDRKMFENPTPVIARKKGPKRMLINFNVMKQEVDKVLKAQGPHGPQNSKIIMEIDFRETASGIFLINGARKYEPSKKNKSNS